MNASGDWEADVSKMLAGRLNRMTDGKRPMSIGPNIVGLLSARAFAIYPTNVYSLGSFRIGGFTFCAYDQRNKRLQCANNRKKGLERPSLSSIGFAAWARKELSVLNALLCRSH